MINVLILNLLPQFFLLMVGWSVLQWSRRQRVSLLYDLPYAWGLGVVFLYLIAFPLVRFDLSPDGWHWIVVLLGSLTVIGAVYRRRKSAPQTAADERTLSLEWYDFVLIGLISVKLILLAYGNIVNPVVDSDATNEYRHVGLAKYLFMRYPLSETMAYQGGQATQLSPSLLHAWSNMFQDRWHDSVATIHYLFITLFTLMLVALVGIQRKIRMTWVLLAVYLFSTFPLLSMHVVRPGFSDLLVMHFVAVAVTVLLLSCGSEKILPPKQFGLLLTAAVLGLVMTKMEGAMWALWFILVFFSLHLNREKNISWKKIGIYYGGIAIAAYGAYLLSADWVLNTFDLPRRIQWMFEREYDPRSFKSFFSSVYASGGSGLVWWLFSIASVLVLVKSKAVTDKAVIVLSFASLTGLFYFANFTGNIQYTLNGTNVGRFLLQLSPLALIAYYLLADIFVKEHR